MKNIVIVSNLVTPLNRPRPCMVCYTPTFRVHEFDGECQRLIWSSCCPDCDAQIPTLYRVIRDNQANEWYAYADGYGGLGWGSAAAGLF